MYALSVNCVINIQPISRFNDYDFKIVNQYFDLRSDTFPSIKLRQPIVIDDRDKYHH